MSAREEGLMAQVPREPTREGPSWLSSLRRESAERLREGGFPGKKHEKWRFTSVREVVDTAFEQASAKAREPDEAVSQWVEKQLGDEDAPRVVLADGRIVGMPDPIDGVRIESLKTALEATPAGLEDVLGALAPREHFAALNAALFDDGVLIRVTGAVEQPIHLVHVARASKAPTAAYPRVVVLAEAGSSATLIESYLVEAKLGDGSEAGPAKHLTSPVTEVRVEDDARLEHVRIVFGEPHAFHLGYLAIHQARGSFYASRAVTLGGALSRVDLDATLAGEGAEIVLEGVYQVGGREHVDHQVCVEHTAPRTTSTTRYRGLLDGEGHAVMNLMGIVRPSAPGTVAHQENRNLLLSDDATIDTKPHLEIETDDIEASHGATIGALDETALFYLRSRGIPEAEARDVLTFAFVRALIEHIPHPPTVRRASEAVLGRLPSAERIREVAYD